MTKGLGAGKGIKMRVFGSDYDQSKIGTCMTLYNKTHGSIC